MTTIVIFIVLKYTNKEQKNNRNKISSLGLTTEV